MNSSLTHPTIFKNEIISDQWIKEFLDVSSSDADLFSKWRLNAWQVYKNLSIPKPKENDWSWLNFSDLEISSFRLGDIAILPANNDSFGLQKQDLKFEKDQIVIGNLTSENELAANLSGKIIPPETGMLEAWTSALAGNGVLIYIPKDYTVTRNLTAKIRLEGSNTAAFSHSIIWLEAGSSCTIILDFESDQPNQKENFHSGLLEIYLGDGASLNLTEIQNFNSSTFNITNEKVKLGRQAKLKWNYAALGSMKSKNFITADLEGYASEAILDGFYFSGSNQTINLDTQQNHLAPETKSNLMYKGAANRNGKAIWEGMIYVDVLAQKSNGYQANRNLILSDDADIKSIPGLEICANDVSCSHGATVGRLDDEELFYLGTRGIPHEMAEEIIVEGFFSHIIDGIPDEEVKEEIKEIISQKIKSN